MTEQNPTFQFEKSEDHDRVAFKAFVSVYSNGDKHVVIGAPTVARLTEFWSKIAKTPLNQSRVQEVFIVKAKQK